jgi:hypothetical protein
VDLAAAERVRELLAHPGCEQGTARLFVRRSDRGVFLLGTFLCTSKEKYLACGARTALLNQHTTIARSANKPYKTGFPPSRE